MYLLHFLQALTGDAASVGIPVTVFFIVIFCIFLFGAIKRAKAAGGVWWKQQMARYYLLPIIGFWIGAMAWCWSEYRHYDAKKDGVPQTQTDTTRQAAEDQLPK